VIWIEELNLITGEGLYRLARFRLVWRQQNLDNMDLASGEFIGWMATDSATTKDTRQHRMKRSTQKSKPVLGEPRLGKYTLQNSEKIGEQLELWDATAVCHILKHWKGLGNEIEEVVALDMF
jgi:hypothetical protein